MPIFISQSGNTKALGLEGMGDFLENFALIRLGKIANKYLKYSPNTEVREACKNIAYPMLINEDDLYLHPTHGHYQKVAKHQPPINIKPVICEPFTINFNISNNQQIITKTQNTGQCPVKTEHAPNTLLDKEDTQETWYNVDALERAYILQSDVLVCPNCQGINIKNNGKTSSGKTRKRCNDCGKSWSI